MNCCGFWLPVGGPCSGCHSSVPKSADISVAHLSLANKHEGIVSEPVRHRSFTPDAPVLLAEGVDRSRQTVQLRLPVGHQKKQGWLS